VAAVANTIAFGAGQDGVRLLLQTLRLRGVGQELRSALQLIGTLAAKQALLSASHLAPPPHKWGRSVPGGGGLGNAQQQAATWQSGLAVVGVLRKLETHRVGRVLSFFSSRRN
jgi:hypothetical protein